MCIQSSFDAALNVYNPNSYICIDQSAFFERNEGAKIEMEIAQSPEVMQSNPEQLYMRKEIKEKSSQLLSSLSQEAQEIISIICDCPSDLIHLCKFEDLDKVDVPRIAKMLRKQWKDRLTVKEIMKEVFMFAKKVEEMENGN